MSLAHWQRAVRALVSVISATTIPSQVRDSIVLTVTVVVTRFMIRGAWSDERFEHEPVNGALHDTTVHRNADL